VKQREMSHLLLSQSERLYYKSAAENNIRNDGRSRLDHRKYQIDLGVISAAHGSAKVKLGTCDVLVAIKLELGMPDLSQPMQGKLFCNVECSASASQEFEGKGAEEFNRELSQIIYQFIDNTIDKKHLLILEGEQCWFLYIDILVLDYGGSLINTIMLATRSALYDTRIPKVTVLKETQEIIISDNLEEAEKIDISEIPLTVTICIIDKTFLIDPQWEEELCANTILLIGITQDGYINGMMKQGSNTLSLSLLEDICTKLNSLSKRLHEAYNSSLQEAILRSLNTNLKNPFLNS
jgi:exosome complex component RRP42